MISGFHATFRYFHQCLRLVYNTRALLSIRMQDEWTEKYRPKSLSEIVGNDAAIRVIRRWADSWKRGPPRLKAITLRGEPGTGKTSAALALARDMDWDYIEMNASDHRNAASINKVAGAGSRSQTFTLDGEFLSASDGRRKLVILDEADNLFGREDYGGAKAIVETIRESAHPIILIVNDFYELTRRSPAIKTLTEMATFKRLDDKSVVAVLKSISGREKVAFDDEILSKIAQNSGGDLRAAVNDLQMLAEGRRSVTSLDSDSMGKRNQEKELDAALRTMFGADTVRSARDATFDIDKTPDELVKWIEENIPLEFHHPGDLASAFDALSRSDIYLGWTRRLQHYGLWAYAKEMMTGGVVLSRKEGVRPSVYQYRFPGSLILMSRAKGPRAARDALAGKLQTHLHTSRKCVSESALPYLGVMVKNDPELLLKITVDFELDDGDLAFLLGTTPDSSKVQETLAKAKASSGREDMPAGSAKPRTKRATGRKGAGHF